MSIAAALTATVGVLVALASYFFADLTKRYFSDEGKRFLKIERTIAVAAREFAQLADYLTEF